jgi:hypothetical protein
MPVCCPTTAGVAAKAGAASTARSATGGSQEVPVAAAVVFSGTFTVHAKHPLKFTSGVHQWSAFFSSISTPQYVNITDIPATVPWLPDGVHKLEFVDQSRQYA